MTKYDHVTIFTKKGNLIPFMNSSRSLLFDPCSERGREYYGKERDIQLVLATRWGHDSAGRKTRLMCKISCPVNPLPVKGEFEAPSRNAIEQFLYAQGWTKKEAMSKRWFE